MSEGLERRKVLQGLAAATLGARVLDIVPAYAQHQVPWSAGTEAPKLKAPANACDCHMHIYDSRFPIAPSATLKPADAKTDDYKLLQKRIGTTRNVVVQPSTYGTDNACTLDGMAKIGPTSRGVAVVDTSVSDAELKRLHELGVRGIRFTSGCRTKRPATGSWSRTRSRSTGLVRRPDRGFGRRRLRSAGSRP